MRQRTDRCSPLSISEEDYAQERARRQIGFAADAGYVKYLSAFCCRPALANLDALICYARPPLTDAICHPLVLAHLDVVELRNLLTTGRT